MNRDETPGAGGSEAAEPARTGDSPTRREVRWSFRRPDKHRDRPEPEAAATAAESGRPAEWREPGADTDPESTRVTQPGRVRTGADRDAAEHGSRSHRSDDAATAGAGRPGSLSAAHEARAQEPGAKDPLAPGAADPPAPRAESAPAGAVTGSAGSTGLSAKTRWRDVQSAFVDDPPRAVRDADALIAGELEALTARLVERRRALRGVWEGEHPADTELLRTTLREYRDLLELVTSVETRDRPAS
ncbi:hypothetical protein CLV63_102329 [Murinocardiopsis flavida]|uniref:Uncharacterized protein n=1 Tax=Murinocardiopsis flavida TaxID=645275 RepID=A0A2P8DSL4_9ACTN|nr:hypothetical protein [Murinocardiopsis flavida]PSL00202.1 hypothetical protein CLV63_102329 [Murinocardiopsis flavida]